MKAPRTSWNSAEALPRINPTSYISPQATVIGQVMIGNHVFVAPFASVRGDEGGPIMISDDSNIQDGVIIHALKGQTVEVAGGRYAVYIGRSVSLAHRAIVHGPVAIGDNTFIGFGATVFQAQLGRDVAVLHHAVVTGGVSIPDGRLVRVGAVIESQDQADALPPVPESYRILQTSVVRVNRELAAGYRQVAWEF